MDSFEKFDEETLPRQECFYSVLNDEHVSDADYDHATRVFGAFSCQSIGDCHDLYLKSDVLLLTSLQADVLVERRGEYEKDHLLDHLSESCEQILLSDPGARIVIAGDINHLKITDFTRQHNLDQLVKKFTRGLKTLDVFPTNRPYIWKVPTVFTSLVRYDYLAVMVTPQTLAKAERKRVFFRDVREHRKIEMEKRLKEYNWTSVNNTMDASEAVSILTDAIGRMYNDCFPLIKVKVSSRDPPYMTPLVKHLCKMRNKQIRMGISPELQEKINILIRDNQISSSQG